MIRKSKFIIAIIPILFFFVPLQNVFLDTLCAEERVDFRPGINCVVNFASCPTGSTNLLQMSNSSRGRYSNRLNGDKLSRSIIARYGGDINNPSADSRSICIRENYNNFVLRWMTESEASDSQNENLPSVESLGSYRAIPRVCPAGWTAQEGRNTIYGADNIFADSTIKLQGCCPVGFQFVNISSNLGQFMTGGQGLQAGVCCRGSGFDEWDSDFDNGGCKKDGNVVIPNNSGQHNGTYSTFEQALSAMAQNSNIIIGVRDTGSGWSTRVNNPSEEGLPKPQFGLGLGPDYPGLAVAQNTGTGAAGGSSKICPQNTACAVTDPENKDSIISPALYSSSTGLNCDRCFSNGDPIAVITDSENSANNKVRFCDASSPTLYREETLIGTDDITQGYLLEEGDNADLYRQCFETGGIYTAIGCIDPTPTGIITGLIRIALGVMGGVALLQMIYVGLLYQMGNTEKIKEARTQLIATLIGIAVLVFSVLILRIIGVNVLDILPEGSV